MSAHGIFDERNSIVFVNLLVKVKRIFKISGKNTGSYTWSEWLILLEKERNILKFLLEENGRFYAESRQTVDMLGYL